MKSTLNRTLVGLAVASALLSATSYAAPALTGFSSDSTIPFSLFEDTEISKPWVKPSAPKKKNLNPATMQNVQQAQQLKQLEQSLSEQQRINKEVLAGHQVEKQALEQQLKALEAEKTLLAEQRKQLELVQQELAQSQDAREGSTQQLGELRAQLESHKLMLDAHESEKLTLTTHLKEKEESVLALSKQLDEQKDELQKLQQQTSQPNAQQLAELKQHQDLIVELQITLTEADKQKAELQQQLAKLKDQPAVPVESAKPENHEQKLSYANGVAFASNIVQSLNAQQKLGVAPDRPMVLAGIRDAFNQKISLNSEEVAKLVTELDSALQAKLQSEKQDQATSLEHQHDLGKKLIEKTKQRKGVKTLDGVYYVVTKAGKGVKLNAESTVDILLTGRLADGTVFDNSGQENKVQRVKVNELLPSLVKVISQVKAGSEVEIILPAEEAFGDEGVEGLIPPGATLVFTIIIR